MYTTQLNTVFLFQTFATIIFATHGQYYLYINKRTVYKQRAVIKIWIFALLYLFLNCLIKAIFLMIIYGIDNQIHFLH